jgi:SNF2 family DNA or RNA helicase
MGLGKTIQTMGLLLSTLNECENTNALERNGSSRPTKNKKITLIVTPLALIQQWANEIRSKTQDGRIKVLVHHGQSRSRDATSFLHYDVIITTYQVVASDYPAIEKGRKKKQVINDMNFDTRSESSVSSSKKRRNGEDAAEDEQSSTVSSPGFGMLDYTGLPDEHSSGLLPSNGYGPLFQVKWHRIVLGKSLRTYLWTKKRMTHLISHQSYR